MNWQSILVLVLVLLALCGAVAAIIKNRGKGCNGDCSGCNQSCQNRKEP